MAGTKEVRKKIASNKNLQKITSAMEKVATSKMRRAQIRMRQGRPYAEKIREAIGHLAHSNPEYRHVYMRERDIKRVGFIVVSTDKGLCGGLNVNLFRKVLIEAAGLRDKHIEVDLALLGTKAGAFFRSVGGNVVAMLNKVGEQPALADLIGGIKVMLDAYEAGRIDRLYIASNTFISAMTQTPAIRQLLPLEPTMGDELQHRWDYLYEPDARQLIDGLVTRFVESQVYQAVVENTACEMAAKMVAMKAATDNAGKVIKELQLAYNKARQSAITQEIAEIVGGAAAV